ncbi:MAG: hypothetical protein IKB07_08165 [Lachnospiraceae bacterium]|nr:hypothetical protein [Lachnospiraceae bacterium]
MPIVNMDFWNRNKNKSNTPANKSNVGTSSDDARKEKLALKNNTTPNYNGPLASKPGTVIKPGTAGLITIPAELGARIGVGLVDNLITKRAMESAQNKANTSVTEKASPAASLLSDKFTVMNNAVPEIPEEEYIGPQMPPSMVDMSLVDSVFDTVPEESKAVEENTAGVVAKNAVDAPVVKPEDYGLDLNASIGISPEDYGIDLDNIGFEYGQFAVSDEYKKAMEYTNSLLSQLNSGKTSYTSQIKSLMDEYRNRDKFSYDMSTDPMFQQMLSASMNSGKMAMQDSMGQAAALTGGYGSTYGQAVGNSAYNQYISEAYNNLPEYYNLALGAYNAEGDKMLSELAMLQDADSAEYNRMLNAYTSNRDNAASMYEREYNRYLNDRSAAEKSYWDDFNAKYGAYVDAYNQAVDDRNFRFGAYTDARDFDYGKALDDEEREYRDSQAALSPLGETEGLSLSEIESIKDTWVANGGASGDGYDAAYSQLYLMGKENAGNEAFGEAFNYMLEDTNIPYQPYIDAVIGDDNLSPERKAELIKKIQEDYVRNRGK